MALLAAPVSAPAEEPWLRACAAAGMDLHVVRGSEGDAAGLERGLEALLGAAAQPGCCWVARLWGDADSVAYAVAVLGVAADGGVAVLPSLQAATACVVDGCAGASHHVALVQCEVGVASEVCAALRGGDMGAALRLARVSVLRDAATCWAVVGLRAGGGSLLWRVAVPGPSQRPFAPASALPLRARSPRRLAVGLAGLLVALVAAGGAGWAMSHRGAGVGAPVLGPIAWNGAGLGVPPARLDAMAATWDRTAQVILFGGATPGAGHGTPLGDTWRTGGTSWQRVTTATAPPARLGGAAAPDAADGYVLLFGGEGPGDAGLGDTWMYGGSWTQLQPQHSPPAGPALAATEPSTGRVVLVTACCALGAVPTGERMQTWRWTGADWALLGPAPGWVTSAAVVADGWDGSVVMLASDGAGGGLTYVWDGAAWAARHPSTSPPVPAGTRPQLTYDPRSRAVLDVVPVGGGSETWAWDGATWTRVLSAGGPATVGLVLGEPVDGHAVLYGGPDQAGSLAEAWVWSGAGWAASVRPPAVAAQPSALFGESVAADPGSGGLLLEGGSGAPGETWVWGGHDWTQAFFATPAPAPRFGAAIAFDRANGRTLLVGGRLDSGALAGDMWEWRGNAWSQLHVAPLPPASELAVMAWDDAAGEAVLVTPEGSDSLPSSQTWTFDGTGWTLRAPSEEPPLPAGSSIAFDPATRGVLLVVPCCPASTTQRSETWRWDGVTWHRLDPLHNPPLHAAIASDAAGGRVVLVAACCAGFDGDTVGPPQTWVWDGTDWTHLAAALPALQDVGALSDDASGGVLLVGRIAGAGPSHPLDGVWRWTGGAWQRLF